MAIPENSLPQITLSKIGNTTMLLFAIPNYNISFKVASVIKRTLKSYKNGVLILPNEKESILNNFYIDKSILQGAFQGLATNEDLLNKIAENKMFQ